ncbi:hypothetical protein V6N13_098532 [Hibiscus sabdariffa]|uniref:Uncharacterized protein n=1 Tax=Hibiscus sabdariffa TaxID=183260 RepID=A0ABR2EE42_9ROSI
MGGEYQWETVAPTVAPLNVEREEQWIRFDNSVNAVSFGFVATAILISMFLLMAIFERFLRPASFSSSTRAPNDVESQAMFNAKLNYPSPKMTVYANEVSVLMPGEEAPTFIAHPAPVPLPPDHTLKPLHQLNQSVAASSSLSMP